MCVSLLRLLGLPCAPRARAPARAARYSTAPRDAPPPVLTAQTVAIVKATVPALLAHATDVVHAFYDILFARHPSVKRLFNMDRHRGGVTCSAAIAARARKDAVCPAVPAQVSALAHAILVYANHIDNVPALLPLIEDIAHKHVSRGVEPTQYTAVGECLLAAIKLIFKDAANDAFMAAWAEAYAYLAAAFIAAEKKIRQDLADAAGYSGFMDMEVVAIEKTYDGGKAFFLVPDSAIVPPHLPGQYVAVSLQDVAVYGSTMTTAGIDSVSEEHLRVFVSPSEERATMHMMKNIVVGHRLIVSLPCGKPTPVCPVSKNV